MADNFATNFATASRLETLGPGRHRGRIDASWGQGRALFGGIQAALLVRACEACVDDPERRLRTLSMSFCRAAKPEEVEVSAWLDRGGRYVSHLGARLTQEGETVATALAVYGRDRDDPLVIEGAEPPLLPPPESLVRTEPKPPIPLFTGHFDMRFVPGTQPYAGTDRAEVSGWVRFAEPVPLDSVAMAALLDVWPPSILTILAPPRASASVDLRYDILQPLPIVGAAVDDFYAFRCRILHWSAGHGVDEGELWTRDGRLVARVRQLRVLF